MVQENIKCRFCKTNSTSKVCPNCGSISINTKNSDKNFNAHFTDYSYNKYSDSLSSSLYNFWNKFLVGLWFYDSLFFKLSNFILRPFIVINPGIDLEKYKTIIDVGCGSASFLRNTPDYILKKGFDIVDYKLDGIDIIVGNFENYKFEDKFDIVRSIHSLEHAQDPIKFLDNLIDITEKGGLLVIASPNSNYWLRDFFGMSWVPLNVDSHYCIMNNKTISEYLIKNNFQVKYSGTYTLFSFIESFQKKFDLFKKFKFGLVPFVVLAILYSPVAIIEAIFNKSDSFLIYAKKN